MSVTFSLCFLLTVVRGRQIKNIGPSHACLLTPFPVPIVFLPSQNLLGALIDQSFRPWVNLDTCVTLHAQDSRKLQRIGLGRLLVGRRR